jgi:indolepyruvate decarboxylase
MNVVDELNRFLDPEEYVVVADVGDALYASVELETDDFLGLGYYNSMGFGVPAAVAAQLALPEKRTIALVGDGAFQMTGMELSTAKKLGVRPTIIILNNARYATLEAIVGVRDYFALQSWDYVAIAVALGGSGTRVQSRRELRGALLAASVSKDFYVIEARLSSRRLSPTWEKIAEGVRSISRISQSVQEKKERKKKKPGGQPI